jgi:hypothetical protein
MMFKDFKIDFKLFQIKEGKLKILPTLSPKHVRGVVIISIIAIIISALSSQFKIDEKQLWKIYTALIERLGLQPQLPDIKDNEKKLDAEIELEVDQAIWEYERLTGDDGYVRIPSPRYSEKPVDTSVCYTDECKSLGGEMRICAPWVDNCPKQ